MASDKPERWCRSADAPALNERVSVIAEIGRAWFMALKYKGY